MGTSSKKLTKYSSGTTIVTADVANSWFGGLYGSYEGSLLDTDDARLTGHVHDGDPYDGHAGKIDLVYHVKSKLQHQNLADLAVEKNNVATFVSSLDAIPEKDVDGNYYLNLTDVYDYIDSVQSPFQEADSNADTVDDVVRQINLDYTSTGLDFVYGSSKLDDMNDAGKGDERFLFDKSKGAFRAGSVNSIQWNDTNRGDYSFATGRNTTASGDGSFAAGVANIASGDNSFVGGGSNTASGNNSAVFGAANTVAGTNNIVSGEANSIIAGDGNSISGREHTTSSYNSIVGGRDNTVEGDYNLVAGYLQNVDDNGNISSGTLNNVRGNYGAAFGEENAINNDGAITADSTSSIVAGFKNTTKAKYTVSGGQQNLTNFGADGSAVFGKANGVFGQNSLVFGAEALSKVDGELSHASGKFSIVGDAQTTTYVVRGRLLNSFGPPGLALSLNGVGGGPNYQMDLNSAYHVSVMLVGKLAGPGSQEAGAYKLESLALGPTTAPLVGTMSAPIVTYISRTAYFNTGFVNATLTASGAGTNSIQINVSDTSPGFIPSNWVATVTLTTCRF